MSTKIESEKRVQIVQTAGTVKLVRCYCLECQGWRFAAAEYKARVIVYQTPGQPERVEYGHSKIVCPRCGSSFEYLLSTEQRSIVIGNVIGNTKNN